MREQPVIKTKARTIIHVGAGTGKRLAEWQSDGPDKIVLVEAERSAAVRLSKKGATAPNVQVVQAALGTEAGDAELSVWNFSRLNSLQEPTPDLKDLYPGLIRKDRQIVPMITPAELFATVGDVARPLAVIIETPGNEMVFLTASKADAVLDQIDQIEIHAPEDALYNGAATRAELEAWLTHEGFAVTARDNSDADWTVLHLVADHRARALSEAKARIDALSQTIAAGEITLAETQSALKAAKDRAEGAEAALAEARTATEAKTEALAERDAALKAEKARSEGLQAVLTEAQAAAEARSKTLAERDAALKAEKARSEGLQAVLTEAQAAAEARSKTLAERDAALKAEKARSEGLQAVLTEAQAAEEAKSKTLAERDAALKAEKERATGLEKTLADTTAAAKTSEKVRAQLLDRVAQLQDDLKRNEFEQTKLRQDLSLALRAQNRLDVDFRDLQERYGHIHGIKQQQDELLRQLTPQLQRAAQEIKALADENMLLPHQAQKKSVTSQSVGTRKSKTAARKRARG
ncbi:hypothetical protein ACLGGT_18700 [Roseovarius sp. MS2]|uniref:hypothetical protein n=1 Tax=Roseovarius sp. MS2 TaxID=3390728 RepID=UPI003EDB97C6